MASNSGLMGPDCSEVKPKLESILGDDRLKDITQSDEKNCLTNSKDIYCECKTLILKSNIAKLILPTESMLELEKDMIFLNKTSDNYFKNLVRGCYWLIDDMYKFEQMGYTKEIKPESLAKLQRTNNIDNESCTNDQKSVPAPNGIRYLLCAECNLCPLGWYDSKTKESYLHVW